MAETFDPDDVEKFFPAIAAAARGVAAVGAKAAKKVAEGGVAAAGKVKEGVGAAATKVKEVGTAAAGKVEQIADKAKNMTPEQKKKLGVAVGVKQQMDQRLMQAEQRKREQHQRASEMARSAASTGTGIGKSQDNPFEIDFSQPSHLETGTFKPDDVCQLCKERPAQYKTGYSARGRPHSPVLYNLCESCFDSFSHGGNMATYSRFIKGGPMDLAWRLLKQQTFNDYFGVKDQWISLPKEGMDERPELYGEVADAMNIAYAPIGGHAKYKNADDLRGEGKHARYDLIDNDEDPYVDAAHVFQETEQGFKSSLLGQDGSRTGRRAIVGHAVEAMNTPGHFMEASGPMAAVLERNQVGVVESPEMIQRVLAGKDIRLHPDGGGVYTRTIGDEEHEKRIFGQPLENAVAVTQPYMEQVYNRQTMTNPFDLFGKSNEFMEDAFDMGYELVDYDDLHDKQRVIADFISNKDGQHVPSYWTDPASGEYETEYYSAMFRPDKQHLYPDEAYDQYLRYLQYYFEEAEHTAALPFEKQSFLMSGTEEATSHPEHPNNAALFRMAMEFPEWDVEDPHQAFYQRYNEPQPQRGLASRMASGGFLRSEVLVKERKSPEAMRHKREYDAAYNKRPDQVKYREELNRERRRRGIMGSHDHMDVSHTQGGKLTLEPEHSNRARHFREKGTLRVIKSMKDDLELLRNLMQGPMDEQDKKIATAMVGMLEERHGDEEEEDELLRPMFGGGDLFV